MLVKTKEGQFLKPIGFKMLQDDWSIYQMGDLQVKIRMVATSMGRLYEDEDGLVPVVREDGQPAVSVSGQLMIVVNPNPGDDQ